MKDPIYRVREFKKNILSLLNGSDGTSEETCTKKSQTVTRRITNPGFCFGTGKTVIFK